MWCSVGLDAMDLTVAAATIIPDSDEHASGVSCVGVCGPSSKDVGLESSA